MAFDFSQATGCPFSSFILFQFGETGGDDVGLSVKIVEGDNQIIEAEVALR